MTIKYKKVGQFTDVLIDGESKFWFARSHYQYRLYTAFPEAKPIGIYHSLGEVKSLIKSLVEVGQ